ncbi:hypothetical protein ACEZDB_30160 [Streptacidiphilus sp. N1-3]|uniref:Recombination endonuclease VII n=1 Tax=Streptacidiphilus alkalitolerans TaxID=3342712 RepID=A0ABV6X9I0_9ACTN
MPERFTACGSSSTFSDAQLHERACIRPQERSMPKEHPDDTEFMAGLRWEIGRCAACRPGLQQAQNVTEVEHVGQGTISGAPIYYCRTCLAYRLVLARAQAAVDGVGDYWPTLLAEAHAS